MYIKKFKYVFTGLIIGIILSISTSVLAVANSAISAWLADYITFEFNGIKEKVPDGYSILIYQDRTYVPARFVAEKLGADVKWDDANKTVQITEKQKEVNDIEANDKNDNDQTTIPTKVYYRLPYTRYDQDKIITIKATEIGDDYTRVYLSMENKATKPLQIVQDRTKIEVDGKEYLMRDIPIYKYDVRWYKNVEEDQTVEGYIVFPVVPEDSKELKIKITVLTNDGSYDSEEIEFMVLF